MTVRTILLAGSLILLAYAPLAGQFNDTVFHISATIYDVTYRPVPATHVINMNTHQGTVSDSLGIFELPVHINDTLLIRNIAYYDTLVPVYLLHLERSIHLKRKRYQLQEARIFEWGSTYSDFRKAIVHMPNRQTLGESMGLPRQDPDYVPLEMDEQAVKSAAHLISSPVSFFYQNFSKEAKRTRKAYWFKKNLPKKEHFDQLVSKENLSEITGLSGDDLMEFQAFLLQRMVSTFKSTDLEVYEEIHGLWKVFRELKEKGVL